VETPVGPIPLVMTELSRADSVGELRVRLRIRRENYAVEPGLYAVGNPSPESPVFVSANFKLSFDYLRRELAGIDGWILVLDTKGINVWCAAGKGTFGTEEIVNRVRVTHLAEAVTHRRLIVPQLGAPGVAAHEVKNQSGFRVIYGPVRVKDIPAFLDARMKATPEMRRVRFDMADRMLIVPVELVQWSAYILFIMACLFLLGGLHRGGYDVGLSLERGSRAALLVLFALLGGAVLTPMLLPWIPGRAFSIKGALIGLVMALAFLLTGWIPLSETAGKLEAAAWLLLIPSVGAFVAMNYTGATTFTSLSGVKHEMRFGIPAQIAGSLAGLGLWVVGLFIA
jgi:acetyl-CoA decarbonylase/synthase complex subunit gamma